MNKRSGFARIVTTVMTAALLLTGTFAITPEKAYAETTTGYVTVGALNLRTGASTGYGIIDVLPKGASVDIIGIEDDWYEVSTTVNGSILSGYVYSGYVSSEYTTDDQVGLFTADSVTSISSKGRVNVSALNVRSSASMSGDIQGILASGTEVTITGVSGDWYQVSVTLNGSLTSAYVYKPYITVSDDSQASSTVTTANGTGAVNVAYLNVRTEPSTSSATKGCVPEGTILEVTGKTSDGSWYRVNTNINGTATAGYVYAECVTLGVKKTDITEGSAETSVDTDMNGTGYVTNCGSLNLRKDASTSSQVISVLPRYTVVTIVGTSGDWYKVTVTVNGTSAQGYVHKDYIAMGQPTENPNSMHVSAEEEYLLACIVYCESGDQSYEGQLAVANVVLNRVRSPQFPNTITEVVYQSGQFTPAFNGRLANALANGPLEICKQAARDALSGNNNVPGYYFFNGYVNVSTVTGYLIIGDHTFYYY